MATKKLKNRWARTLIEAFAIIMFWRGIWGLCDLYIFPGNQALSFLVSAVVGLLILWFDDFSISELAE